MLSVAVGLAVLLGLTLLLSAFISIWMDSEVVLVDDFTPDDLVFVLQYERRADDEL